MAFMKFSHFFLIHLITIDLTVFTLFASNKPNIIIFIADDLGFGDVGYNGDKQIQTPNIDRLASDGVILNNYYTAAVCTPSRGALLSGLYPIHTGTQHYVILTAEPRGFPLHVPLLSNYLKQLNYSTNAIGKWHLGFYRKLYTPIYRGFDYHFGYYAGEGDFYDHTSLEDKSSWGLDFRENLNLFTNATGVYSTNVFTEKCFDVIDKAYNEKQPLFLYVAHQAVHSANRYARLQAPQKYIDMFEHICDERRRIFAAMLYAMDESIGLIFNKLSQRDMLSNSIIIFTSDNGGAASGFGGNAGSNWPLRGVKATLWEGGVRVPAFIWSPLLKKSGYISNALMHISDWLPTIFDAMQINETLTNIDGHSQWKTLSENTRSARKEILLNIDPIWNVSAIRYGKWKLIQGLVYPKWSEWYPPFSFDDHSKSEKFNQTRFNSIVDNTLMKLRENKLKPALNVTVNCGVKPANASTNCKPKVTACLFDIDKDPCEYNNIAEKFPNVVKKLWEKILNYNQTSIAPGNQPLDANSWPPKNNYSWTFWQDDDDNDDEL